MTRYSHPLVVALLFLVSVRLSAAPHTDYPAVDDTSYTEPNGDRVVRLGIDVPASAEDIWHSFTTSEGWKSFAVRFAEVDMKIGGIIETSYNAAAKTGDPDNIKNEIVAYIPGKMMAIRCVQAPRDFQYKQEFFATSTIFELIPAGPNTTRVVLTAVGYRPGEAGDSLFKKFRWGDAYTLEKLRASFDKTTPQPGPAPTLPKN